MGKDAVNKDKAMAAHLKQIGYPHGRRMTHTMAPPDPLTHKYPGSAAQRRILAKNEYRGDNRAAAQQRRGGRGG